MNEITYLKVTAPVRYPEDNVLNGSSDGAQEMPLLCHGVWDALIRVKDGVVFGWPQGTSARLNIKVVDEGSYYLLDAEQNMVMFAGLGW